LQQKTLQTRLISMVTAKSIVSLVIVFVAGSACTSGAGGSPASTRPSYQRVAFPARLRRPAPRLDCPLGMIRTSKVSPSKLSGLMKGHVPTWVPAGFGLVESFGPNGGFGPRTPGGGAIWVTNDCRSIEASAYRAPHVSLTWSIEGAAKGKGCANAVLGPASCWEIQAPGTGQMITVQAMGLSLRQTSHIARSMHPNSSERGLSCQARLKGEKPQSSSVTGSDLEPVPGTPQALELCTYRGLSKDPARSLRLTRASTIRNDDQIQALITALNGLKRVPPKKAFFCPNDTGAARVLRFAYGDGGHLDLIISSSGCRFANNGSSSWFTTPTVWHVLDQIARNH
jgi:hypothetical protein